MQRLTRFVTPLLILALCALVVWWVTRLLPAATTAVPSTATATADRDVGAGRTEGVLASARLFGSRRPGVLSDNVEVLGVVADSAGRGSVIVSVDRQAARIYRVGDTLDGRLVSAIRPGEIELETGGVKQVFSLPPARSVAPGVTVSGGAAGAPSMPSATPAIRMQPAPPAMSPIGRNPPATPESGPEQ